MDTFKNKSKAMKACLETFGDNASGRQQFIETWIASNQANEIGQTIDMRHEFARNAGFKTEEVMMWNKRAIEIRKEHKRTLLID